MAMISNRNTEVNKGVDNRQRGGSAATLILILSLILSTIYFIPTPAHAAARLQMPPNYLILNSGIVGYWTFDGKDMSGTAAFDRSGESNTGSLSGVTRVPGKLGQGLSFDGNDYVMANDSASLDIISSLTLSSWVYRNSSGPILEKGYYAYASAGYGIHITPTTYTLGCGIGNTNKTSTASIPVGEWTYVSCVFDDTANTVQIFINGTLDSTHTSVTAVPTANLSSLSFGVDDYSDPGYWYTGLIDDVRIYNRALSAGEVATLYQQGQARVNKSPTSFLTNGLVGYWTFDGATTTWSSATAGITGDSSGNFKTGTLTNMARATSPAIGKIGQGLLFDGGNDYVSTTLTTAFNDFTACAWFLSTGKSGNTFDRIIDKTYNTGFWIGRNNNNSNSWGGGVLEGASPYGIFVTLTDGIWHHICSVRSGTTHFIYGDGGAVSTSNTVSNTALSTASIKIGDSTALDASFKGNIDDVRIYNRALSADEILQLYNSTR